ncbi:hypothetical protein AVEN_148455-1 [Araneus ventricosus]|uniref:Uncharacterized protein n=1 Tax=Araneus ventricosus TaxID=182803 RepID=A0A4Y2V976_ARAVE|nr:hypothetical protein AVEN_148455-1 [Araneus ventricosus]
MFVETPYMGFGAAIQLNNSEVRRNRRSRPNSDITERSGKIVKMNDKSNAKPDESGIVMQATNSINIIPFDPNNSMNVNSWLKYFNDKCQEYNLDDTWKLNNITTYLKNNALTEYVNSYDTIKTWEEFVSFLTERYITLT